MKTNYHYEYNLRCVDLCKGGIRKGPYPTYSAMLGMKGCLRGQWKVEKVRVYNEKSSRSEFPNNP